jgi:transcriptional regulator with XRE-family HTH domain
MIYNIGMYSDEFKKELLYMKAQRKASGLSQNNVSKKAGISQAAVSKVEAGSNVTLKQLDKYLSGAGLRMVILPTKDARAAQAERIEKTQGESPSLLDILSVDDDL